MEQAIWGLGNFAGTSAEVRDIVINSGCIEAIAIHTDNAKPKSSFLRNSTWCLSNFCRGKPHPAYDKIKRIMPTMAKVII